MIIIGTILIVVGILSILSPWLLEKSPFMAMVASQLAWMDVAVPLGFLLLGAGIATLVISLAGKG